MEKSVPRAIPFRKSFAMSSLPSRFLAACIRGYQLTLSPDHGPLRHLYTYGYCRHEPTCSEFARTMLLERGVVRSLWPITRRLLSCHPWAKPSEEKMRHAAKRWASQR
jgi:uncharacterized protein